MRNCVMVARQTLTLFVWVQILVPQPKAQSLRFFRRLCLLLKHNIEVWLSLVERYVRDVEVAGSNPVTSTIKETSFVYHNKRGFFLHFGRKTGKIQ